MRIGHGYDVHALADDRALIIGGVKIPYQKGLMGHSDADVLLHAVCDALLGACALGDIGKMFPDTDPEYEDADSRLLLKAVVQRLNDYGYKIINIDSTVIAQAPKLKPYIDEMNSNIAECCGIALNCVNVKATTEEMLGFTGSGQGIAAHCVCLIDN